MLGFYPNIVDIHMLNLAAFIVRAIMNSGYLLVYVFHLVILINWIIQISGLVIRVFKQDGL